MILRTQTEAVSRLSFGRESLDLNDVGIHDRIGQNISLNNELSVSFTSYTVNLV